MIILPSSSLIPEQASVVSPLNAIWYGQIQSKISLPQLGHIFLIYPVDETFISCAGTTVDDKHYLLLTRHGPFQIENISPTTANSFLLILMISPEFISLMADFLNIPSQFRDLLHAVPLKKGDEISKLLGLLIRSFDDSQIVEELMMEIVSEVLRLLRLRHEGLLKLSEYKSSTIDDLLPSLLQARQYIEADYLAPIKTVDVANYVAISEYHFARLFKTTFDSTVHQYVMRLRLNEARNLLETSEESITDIAFSVGYNSLSAFIHAFRKQFSMTPSAFRAQFQN